MVHPHSRLNRGMHPTHLFQCLLLIVLVDEAWSHAYLLEPASRNIVSHKAGQETCPHCLQANGPDAVKARGSGAWPTNDDPGSHGLCGDPVQGSAEPTSIADMKYMDAGQPQRTYTAGSVVEFEVGVSTHHWGHYEFRICDKALDKSIASAQKGQECLNTWVLHRAPRAESCGDNYIGDCQLNNPNHPERWYLPPPGATTQVADANWSDTMMRAAHVPGTSSTQANDGLLAASASDEVHKMRFVIPADLKCEHCTLQWYYATGNSCAYDQDYLVFDPGVKFWNFYKASWATCANSCCGPNGKGTFGEEFWNCADIKVVSDGSPQPNPAPTPEPTVPPMPPTPAPSLSPTAGPAPTPAPTAVPAPTAAPTTAPTGPKLTAVEQHGQLRTSGNKIVGDHGEVVHLRGMSLFWSQWSEGSKYYNRDMVRWLVEDWHVNLVRAAMGIEHGGYLTNPDVEKNRVKAIVDAAIEFGIYVIIDWHDHNAEQHLNQAKKFFTDMSLNYGHLPNVIFETFNEPVAQDWATVIKPYHEQVIPIIRAHSNNTIVLGTKRWSQNVDEASANPVLGNNLAYTLHFYANTHRDVLRTKAERALENGVALFVTEWGTCSATGDGSLDLVEAQTWLDFMERHAISDANWAIGDKAEACAALMPGASATGGWSSSDLTRSGAFLRSSIRAFRSENRSDATPTPSPGTCDPGCRDLKETSECKNADTVWRMCSGSDAWWHGQCQATCSKCASGLRPCSSFPSTAAPEPEPEPEPESTTTGGTGPTLAPTSGPTGVPNPPNLSPVAQHGQLRTSGNQILGKHGEPVQLRGMSLFWSQWSEGSKYYNRDTVRWLVDDWHVSLVRAAMAVEHGGYLTNPAAEKARVKAVVDAAIEFGIYVIIDWHDHHAEQHLDQAKTFFSEMAQTYGKIPNVLFETFNEPVSQDWATVIKPYHEAVVPVIRAHSDNLIILGSKTWSQNVDEASSSPVSGTNLAYTLHFYANTHRGNLRAKATTALQNGAALFVTEWGTCSADGNGVLDLVETQKWLDFLQQHAISDANWAIGDKAEACAALSPGASAAGGWSSNDLTTSGNFLRTSLREFHSKQGPISPDPSQKPQPNPTSTSSPTSTQSPGSCDSSCKDVKTAAECKKADVEWSMCSSSDSWWQSQCHFTCSKCPSGSPPCKASPPGDCDPDCVNYKSEDECRQVDQGWSMCQSTSEWWIDQCKAFCGKCSRPACPGMMILANSNNSQPGGAVPTPSQSGFLKPNNGTESQDGSTVLGIVDGAQPMGAVKLWILSSCVVLLAFRF